jgi:oxaloacetate decarboxylase (Na+ extruding) subunit gamma
MEINLIEESIKYMFLGIGIIFVFLAVIMFLLKRQNEILKSFTPQEKTESQTIPQTINVVVEADATNTDAAKIAAVIAAVQHHKNLKG